MSDPSIRVYGIPLSHPVRAVRGMLDRKGLPYRYVDLLGGAHPLIPNVAGSRMSPPHCPPRSPRDGCTPHPEPPP